MGVVLVRTPVTFHFNKFVVECCYSKSLHGRAPKKRSGILLEN